MFEGNPVYNMTPTTPPGFAGLPYLAGDIVAGLTGGAVSPYVPANQSTFDASLAKNVNNPLYRSMMSNVYGQMGYQLGNTVGSMGFVRNLGMMAGYSPGQIQRDLTNMGASFGRSFPGQIVMPLADQMMNSAGLTGGSFIGAANAAFTNRMHLLSPGTLLSPYSAGQQHQAMGAASSIATMMNGLMSQTDPNTGGLTLLPNLGVTQGFSRERLTQLAMRAAGSGMFNSFASGGLAGASAGTAGGFSERLSQAAGGVDLAQLDFTAGDFSGGGDSSNLGDKAATKVKAFTREFAHRMQGVTQAMAAMRDLTKEVDGLEEKLDALTNGDWLRSGTGAFSARDAVRTLHAVTQMYNLDPKAALGQIIQNRSVLQDAAGFDASMQAMGFNGGGMFGLSAQTELLSSVEDMISARGVRGDPIKAGRLRQQGLQAMARNMNTMAGRGAQVLAYARQMGIVSKDEARRYQDLLTSGDRGLMEDGLNRLLVTTFGSAEAGRKAMNDQMQMNSLRQAMNDEAGVFAMQTTIRGADNEFMHQERVTAAAQRLAFSQQALTGAGMNAQQTNAGVMKIVDSVAATLRGLPGGDPYADAFKEQVTAMVGKGMTPQTALNAAIAAFRQNPVTAKYAGKIDLAVKRQSATNNEAALLSGGLASQQANDVTRALVDARMVDGKDSAEIFKLIREGKGQEALSRVDSIVGGLSDAQRRLFSGVRDEAARRYEATATTIQDNRISESLVRQAGRTGYGSQAVSEAYSQAVEAARGYLKDGNYDNFWEKFSKSKFSLIFGPEQQKKFLDAINSRDEGYFKGMGRRSNTLRQMAASNLASNGYDLHYQGYWGGGIYAGNDEVAASRRNKLISDTARAMEEDSLLQSGDRSTLAQDLVGFLTGEKDWKGLLKIYDKDDKLTSRLSKYGTAFKDYESARAAFDKTQKGYSDTIKRLNKAGKTSVVSRLEDRLRRGDLTGEAISEIRTMLEKDGVSGKDFDAIMASVDAMRTMGEKQQETERAITETVKEDGFSEDFKSMQVRKAAAEARNSKIAGDASTLSFLRGLDLEESSISGASGKLKEAYDKMFAAVSDDEVAQAKGIKSSKSLSLQDYAESSLAIMQKKALAGDEKALDAMRAFKAASNEGVTKIRGEIIVKSGNDQSPAILDANVGGLG